MITNQEFEIKRVKQRCQELENKLHKKRKFFLNAEVIKYLDVYAHELKNATTCPQLNSLEEINSYLDRAIEKNDLKINQLERYLYPKSLIDKYQEQSINDYLDYLDKNKFYCCGFFINYQKQSEFEILAELKQNLKHPNLGRDTSYYIQAAKKQLVSRNQNANSIINFLYELLMQKNNYPHETTPLLNRIK